MVQTRGSPFVCVCPGVGDVTEEDSRLIQLRPCTLDYSVFGKRGGQSVALEKFLKHTDQVVQILVGRHGG